MSKINLSVNYRLGLSLNLRSSTAFSSILGEIGGRHSALTKTHKFVPLKTRRGTPNLVIHLDVLPYAIRMLGEITPPATAQR